MRSGEDAVLWLTTFCLSTVMTQLVNITEKFGRLVWVTFSGKKLRIADDSGLRVML